MSRNYKFHNPEGVYFVSFAVVGWLDACRQAGMRYLITSSVLLL